jgi:hypothetical protein
MALCASRTFAQIGEQLDHFGRCRVTHGIGCVERRCASSNRGAEHFDEKIRFGAQRVFGGKLNVCAVFARTLNRCDSCFQHLRFAHAELVFAMQRTGREKQVNARMVRAFECARRCIDITVLTSCECAHRRVAQRARDFVDRCKIVGRSLRKACFQHVHAKAFEGLCHAQFRSPVHGKTGRLLAVAQGGVEDPYAVFGAVAALGVVGWICCFGVHAWLRLGRCRGATKNPASLSGAGFFGVSRLVLLYLDTRPQPAPPLVIRSTSTRERRRRPPRGNMSATVGGRMARVT